MQGGSRAFRWGRRIRSFQGKVRAQIPCQEITFQFDICDRLVLRLDLDEGLLNDIPHSASIEFSCSHQEKLIFLGEFNGGHSFVWATRHACSQRTTGFRNLISVMQDEADEPVPEGEGEKEGDDDLLPNQSRHTMRRWMAIILVVVA